MLIHYLLRGCDVKLIRWEDHRFSPKEALALLRLPFASLLRKPSTSMPCAMLVNAEELVVILKKWIVYIDNIL